MEFKNDIIMADKNELVLVALEMFFCFLKEGEILKAREVLEELKVALNFKYEISYDLYSLYKYVDKLLVKYQLRKDDEVLNKAIEVMVEIEDGFKTIIDRKEHSIDTITYGKNTINENLQKTTREYSV
ncbi:MAG: flagellar protein FliS [Clostridia bacterium]|jgi:flagellar protein FliS|nr:flagellar protein FliS [Clostridia bacterium]